MDYLELLKKLLQQEINVLQQLDLMQIQNIIPILESCRINKGTIYICGNGGSAAIASHFVCDFNKGLSQRIPPYKLVCLNDNIPIMTAIANDISYERIFAEQIKNMMQPQDVLIVISGSGQSPNIIQALVEANNINADTIAIVGFNGGQAKNLAKYVVHIPTYNMQISEDVFLIINHLIKQVLS